MRFWLQEKAPAGNWVDSIGSNDKDSCIRHANYLINKINHPKSDVRVIERIDIVVWDEGDYSL